MKELHITWKQPMFQTVAVPDDFTEQDAEQFQQELIEKGSACPPTLPFRGREPVSTRGAARDEVWVALEELPEVDLSPNENFQRAKRIKQMLAVDAAKREYFGRVE